MGEKKSIALSSDKGKIDDRKTAPLVGKVNFANITAAEYHLIIKAYDGAWRTFLQNACHTGMASVVPTKIPVGKKFWTFPAAGGIDSSPVNYLGVMYVGCDDHNIYAIDESTGRMIWHKELGDKIKSSPAVGEDHLLIGCEDKKLYKLDRKTGNIIWTFTAEDCISSSRVVCRRLCIYWQLGWLLI